MTTTAAACCDLHGRNCEPPSELCCSSCTEATHPGHTDGSACSNPDISAGGPWLPDGHGLPEPARIQVANDGATVHLRLTQVGSGRYPLVACGAGLGQLWTGKLDEVTCTECPKVVHA